MNSDSTKTDSTKTDSFNNKNRTMIKQLLVQQQKQNYVKTASGSTTKTELCDKTACNNVMKDWVVNKYWAFGDTANSFGECKKCDSKWFKAPSQIDGKNWTMIKILLLMLLLFKSQKNFK
jgi:hypothetical protein